ncbi:MAG: permease-like cell division protein FtsX [Pseudomonadota bacterium]|nr:permease-like cell division protein FtsX [Pseudomonadota bacterium]
MNDTNNKRKIPRFSPLFHWMKLHKENCLQALFDLGKQPFNTSLTIVVIAVALALPTSLNILIQNGQNLSGGWEGMRDFSIYLKVGQKIEVAKNLAVELRQIDLIGSVELKTSDDALEEFRDSSGLNDVIDALNNNPLPHTLVIRPKNSTSLEYMESLAEELTSRQEIDIVKLDSQWLERLNAILDFLKRSMGITAAMLLLAVIIIISNTIRLEIQNRSDKIEILKLLGASNGFVRRPFLYIGFWYGAIGSLTSLIFLLAGGFLLSQPLEKIIGLYESQLQLLGLDKWAVLTLIGGGVIAGWGGAYTAVNRHLHKIEPQ